LFVHKSWIKRRDEFPLGKSLLGIRYRPKTMLKKKTRKRLSAQETTFSARNPLIYAWNSEKKLIIYRRIFVAGRLVLSICIYHLYVYCIFYNTPRHIKYIPLAVRYNWKNGRNLVGICASIYPGDHIDFFFNLIVFSSLYSWRRYLPTCIINTFLMRA